jgi:OOP family OmpA-OmpF porin
MVRNTILATLLIVVCGVATAAEPNARGGYIGGALGVSTFDDDGAFSGFNFDDQDTAFQVHGGYKFLKYFAVEARYVNFGTFALDGFGVDVTAASIHAVGIIPFGTSGWELFGQIGTGQVTFESTGFADEDETTVAGGIGVRYNVSQGFSVAVQTDVYVWEDDSFGNVYDFAVGGSQLAFQLSF